MCGCEWASLPIQQRIARVCPLRHVLAANPQRFIDAIQLPFRQSSTETLTAEIMPLADACKFLERNARQLLRPRRLGARGRPAFLVGVRSEVRRVPWGTVLVIGPGNYPLMLPGIQIIQALVAGNRVVFKPAPGTAAVAAALSEAMLEAGLPAGLLTILDEPPDSLEAWWSRVHKVVVTGSEATGRAVMKKCAEHLLPSTMELSGFDAAIVLAGADLQRVVSCLKFGITLNGGHSCIAPRRVIVDQLIADQLSNSLASAGIDCGQTALQLHRTAHVSAMIDAVNQYPLRLGVSIFGPVGEAIRIARLLHAGSIVINDLIVPTADPRLPFGGAGASGFGVTRGAEGLLEMTRPQVISTRRGRLLLHLRPYRHQDEALLRGQFALTHGKHLRGRAGGLLRMMKAMKP